jgi:Flp pilus assembly protein TadB
MPWLLARVVLGVTCLALAVVAFVLALVARHERRLRAVAGAGPGERHGASRAQSGRQARVRGDALAAWKVRPAQGLAMLAGLGCAGLVAGLLVGGSGGGVWGLAGGLAGAGAIGGAAARRRAEQLSDGFRAFVRDVQVNAAGGELAGRAIAQAALRTRGDLRAALDRVVAGWQAGAPLEEALSSLPALAPCQECWSFLQSVWLHCQTGASLAELVGAVVDQSDEARLRQGELAAKAADARWTARVLTVVPPALALYLSYGDQLAWAAMRDDQAGRAGALLGGVLWLMGVLVVGRMQAPPAEFGG